MFTTKFNASDVSCAIIGLKISRRSEFPADSRKEEIFGLRHAK